MSNKKEENILIIVESPNKVKTLKQFLPKNYTVMASVGHICKIANKGLFNMGIDVNDNFKVEYVISEDKKDIFKKLKAQVAISDKVILASDPDREGELIAYCLKKFLKISNKKYERVTYHEITKRAVMEALSNPSKIDNNKAMSAMTRARLDKIVGYRLSSIAKRHVSCKSVGRCQSSGLKVIVEREEEIQKFKITKYFELFINFKKNSKEYTAKYIGTDENKYTSFDEEAKARDVVEQCSFFNYFIKDINFKDRKVKPKLPFTTSTFQQEVSNKLGISVKQAMSYAQKLFEGVNINGQHQALITYIRTDSTEFAPEFVTELTSFIKDNYGNEYYSPIAKQKKKENVQDGHEAIRPVNLAMTPNLVTKYLTDPNLISVYNIIYKRTVASSMSSAIISDTEYVIRNGQHNFIYVTHNMKFDGFKKVYTYKEDDEEELTPGLDFEVDEVLDDIDIKIVPKKSRPPKRYSESSFISTLDKLGIGRPSTYASIVSTLLDEDRGYCTLDDKVIVPTSKGIELIHFLNKSFNDIVNVNYTSNMEKSLDLISDGKLNDIDFLTEFYTKLDSDINKVSPVDEQITDICPDCGKSLVYRKGPYGNFLGCSGYPTCRYIKKLQK